MTKCVVRHPHKQESSRRSRHTAISAGRRMIKSVLDQLLCSGYFLLLRLRMHSHAGTKERCHMGVLVVAFFWIPACAGMTRGGVFIDFGWSNLASWSWS